MMTEEKKEMKSKAENLFEELRRLSPKVTGGLLRMRQETFRDGEVPGKYKLLTAMAISIAIRCEPCIRAYIKLALDRGATQEEFIEFLNVAMTMQGCTGEEWALKAYGCYKELLSGQTQEINDSCCATTHHE
ncbi:MAG: carboxymuconolactone decarboxylase family protein [Nitrospirota bacterium]